MTSRIPGLGTDAGIDDVDVKKIAEFLNDN
jgi:hypothetical protein